MLREIEASEEKREWCRAYSAYTSQADTYGIAHNLRQFMKDTYRNGVVIGSYRKVMERLELDERQVLAAEKGWVDILSISGAAACLAYHFLQDRFYEGSLINGSVANGCVLRLMDQIYKLLTAIP